MVEGVEADPGGSEERLSHVFKIQDQALVCTKTPRVYDRDSRRRDLFHSSVFGSGHLFSEKRSGTRGLAGNGGLEREQRVPFSAPGVGVFNEQYIPSAERGRDVPG